jgi:hypothetical protein
MHNASTLSSLGGFHGMRFFEALEVGQDEPLLVAELHIADARRLFCGPVIERPPANPKILRGLAFRQPLRELDFSRVFDHFWGKQLRAKSRNAIKIIL